MAVGYLSLLIGFLAGTATGAAGHYFGQKFTEQRQRKEAAKEVNANHEELVERFPELLAEMKDDVRQPGNENVRLFYVINRGINLGSPSEHYRYYPEEHRGIDEALRRTEEMGFVKELDESNVPKYRMTAPFVRLLQT